MPDYSKMSDAELMALVQPAPAQDYSKMSDADLLKVVKPERGVIDMLTGRDGRERLQLWPERLARGILSSAVSGATLPGDLVQGKLSVQPEKPGEWSEIDQFRQNIMDENTGHRMMDLTAFAMPVNPAVRAGDRAIPGVLKATKEKPAVVPTTKELAEAGAADIQAARGSDLVINPAAVAEFSKRVQQNIRVHPSEAPATFAKLNDLENPASGAVFTPNDLQAFRESLGATAQNFNPNFAQDQLAATRAIKEFDGFLRGLSPKDTLVRPSAAESAPATRNQIVAQALAGKREAERVAGVFERGRGNYAAAMRSNDITGELDRARTGILERAEGRAQAAHSGRNMDNTLRQKTEAVLEKPKEISGYSDDELAALERVVEGGAGRNLARKVSNKLGGGGGAAQTLFASMGAGAGAAAAGLPGAILGAAAPATIGSGARSIANFLAKKDMRAVDELLRKRSPLYEERAANPGTYVISPEKRAAIARMLLMERMNEQ